MTFAKSVLANSRKAMWRVNNKCYEIAKELFESIVKLTPSPDNPGPYAQGHLADQWYPDEGDFSEELSSSTSPNGAGSLARIMAMKGGAFNGRDGKVTLTNNVDYAYRAEVLGWPAAEGWSGKIGPYRMVARSIQIIKAKQT